MRGVPAPIRRSGRGPLDRSGGHPDGWCAGVNRRTGGAPPHDTLDDLHRAGAVRAGGGYVALAGNLEGRQVADWFTARGVTAFVLRDRYGATARLPVPLFDGARAIRSVRADAAKYGIDPARIGMIGFPPAAI